MNVTEILDDNNSLCNCTNDNDDDFMTIEISPLFLIISLIPCVLSIICCLSFFSYGFIKVLINKKKYKLTYSYMYNDYDNDNDIIIQAIKLSILDGILFICLMSLIVYTLIKPLL